MGTRCIIKIQGITQVAIYKHWDGHPDDMLEPLKEFNKEFEENRPNDPSYKFAQLLRRSTEILSYDSKFTGWGIVISENDGDYDCWQSYEYELLKDGNVLVNGKEWVEE